MPFVRFLMAGAINTLGSLALYMLLVEVVRPAFAWAIAFACGIVFVNVVYPRFVFRVKATVVGATGNTLYYIVSFLASESLLATATHGLEIGPRLAGALVAAVMIPINFLVARFFYTRSAPAPSPDYTQNDK
jgi:putative flippase GtrA